MRHFEAQCAAAMEEEERQLEAHFDQQAAHGNLGQWYTEAAAFLKRTDGHWWCRHSGVTRCLGEVLRCAKLPERLLHVLITCATKHPMVPNAVLCPEVMCLHSLSYIRCSQSPSSFVKAALSAAQRGSEVAPGGG